MKFVVNFSVPEQRILDLFISACEGGSSYWCMDLTPKGKSKDAYRAMLGGFTLVDSEDGKKHTVTPKDIHRALELFPMKDTAHHFADFIRENDDSETGDVFLQLCVFGEVIYG